MQDIIVIGAGAVGAFIARNLSKYEVSTLVLEKENDVCDATSMANSAIAHSGYDPLPGTKKAYFNVRGNKMLDDICRDLDVAFMRNGTLTVATEDEQLPILKDLAKRSELNGVPCKILTAEEVKNEEPNITPNVKAALLCPTGGIINPFELVAHAFENATDNGVEISFGTEVKGIKRKGDHFIVITNKGDFASKIVINAAGVYSDKIAAMIEDIDWSITPRKGEYFVLDHFKEGLVNHVIFPLPSSKGKGILVTRTTSGNYLVGPSSEFIEDKDDVSTDSLTLSAVKTGATSLVPNIPFNQQIRTYSGLRATSTTHDFIIEPSKTYDSFINVAGIESPGLVSSPAIGEYVVEELVSKIIDLKKKEDYEAKIRPYVHEKELTVEERNELIKKNPHFGTIICNCEEVSLGQIEDVINRSLPCLTVKALKKRTRAGFGKCQGGFCQPQVVRILAKAQGISPTEVLYDKTGSNIIVDLVKKEAK